MQKAAALRGWLVALAVVAGLPGVAGAQTDPVPEDTGARAPLAPLAPADVDAQVQALRQQLAAATDSATRFRLLDEIADVYNRARRVPDALRVSDEIVQDTQIGPGRRSLRASALALQMALGLDQARSQRYIARARELAAQATPQELDTLPDEPSFAVLGAESEIARRFLARHDLALAKTRELSDLAWANFNNPALSDKRRQAAATALLYNVNQMVRVLVQNNRRTEALSYILEIQQRLDTRPDLKANARQQASIADAKSIALSSQDDYDGALTAIDDALAILKKADTPEHENGYGTVLRMRLMVALALGRIGDYQADADALLRARAVNPVLAANFGAEEPESLAYASRGQWKEAGARVGEAMTRNARRQGIESPYYKYEAAMQLLYKLNDPAGGVTEADITGFVNGLASDDGDWADTTYRGSYVEDGALATSIGVLMPGKGATPPDSAVALAFRISELFRSNGSQGALADGAARLAAGNPQLRGLIEQEQVLRFDQTSSRRAFASSTERVDRLAVQPSADERVARRQADDAAAKARTFEASQDKLRQLRRQISAQFPVYRELVSPSLPGAARIGAALKPGEVYLNLYAGSSAGFAFVVQPGGKLTGTRLDITRAQTRALIASLRKPFDAGLPPLKAGDLGGFDLNASHGLYKAWLAPLQSQLQGARTIYISAGGLLASLPWNVLTTQPAKTLADAQWWVGQVTPVIMPSASALVLERSMQARSAGSPFVAYADPAFDGRDVAVPPDAATRSVRKRAVSVTVPDFDYRQVNRLPETLDEARAIATTLGASEQSVVHGTQATRTQVMQQDLSDTRVLEFATHGLLPGEVPGMLKAGLAMAYEGRGLGDSVLTIDDIVGLRLNADWVVLSACNTGFASGAAGDSMSALSRGFFAAGGRTVLATQWSVESQSAKQLTVGLFKALAADPAVSKAEALASTERAMIAGTYGALYRHPYYWAPYFIAGDAAR